MIQLKQKKENKSEVKKFTALKYAYRKVKNNDLI